ncbi:MAG: hypothetical protein HY922_15005 [Elusimicrobia bacterium]|nr:hypothetical protein [Elusimicrobiota bacterium]
MRFFRKDKRHAAHPQAAQPEKAAQAPAIPSLKRKEEEKKGGGGWLSGSTPGASGIAVRAAHVGAGAARGAGILGSRAIAAALSKALGGPGTLFGALFASKFGSSVALAALFSWAGLMSLAAFSMLGGENAPAAVRSMLSLGMGESGILIDKPKDGALDLLAKANEGELAWDQSQQKDFQQEAAKEEPKADAAKEPEKAPEGLADPASPDVNALPGGLADGFSQKLSKSFGGGGAGALALGGPEKGLKSGTGGFNLKTGFGTVQRNGPKGKMAAFGRSRSALSAKKISTLRGRSSRAMGQLKLARTMSNAGAASTPDTQARQYSADAFDQRASVGAQMAEVEPGGVVVPPSAPGGAGTPPVDDSVPDAPPVNTPENATPYQPNLDAAKGMGQMAGMLKLMSMMLLAIGAVLIGIGIKLMGNPLTSFIGAVILAMGLALVAMGMMMLMAAGQMADAAKGMGDQISDQYGQEDQGQIVNECSDQALADGTAPANCRPATQPVKQHPNPSLKQDIENERNATYELGDGGSEPAK